MRLFGTYFNKIWLKILFLLSGSGYLLPMSGKAQNTANPNSQVEMADFFYSSGKIYVVIGVIAIIFIGIVLFLIWLERRIAKLEKEQSNH
ncbi:MAG: hypothetical protein IT272_08155 [Chitinophagales bacterium]|jgi:uncharacterized iron-regulated membrane protein|nr:hypothetical protein [Chitinophagales bacterium]MCC7057373.1 hypothetical protein [Chitinophagales bacterium]MDA0198796.1 CcmD family protein [Bacteroidota bacterium]HMS51576.1 hypothetical protein [Chitinophagales bacterium]